ncbi:MAG TPA: hypothetical protein DHN33_04305 [Eubacteriaceae bacterium]|nr:hypothetical protein [Eubacteriaceae bacterium]
MANVEPSTGAKKETRLYNSMRNTAANLIGQVLFVIAGLFLKRVMLQTLGTERIGLNYLFSDIIALLSIAELGLTGIIAYHLYKPLAVGNKDRVKQLMGFFKRSYALLGLLVIVAGIAIVPFLDHLVGETSLQTWYIAVVFLLFLARGAEGYFLSYKQIVLHADQKNYIVTIVDIATSIVYTLIAIYVVLKTENFIYVIALDVFKKTVNDGILIAIVNRKYPYLKKNRKITLPKEDRKVIGQDVKNAFASRISSSVITATDNVVISTNLGIAVTGLYSNYVVVFKIIEEILIKSIESVQASVGNLLAENKNDITYSVLNKITLVTFFLVSISGTCLLALTTPFISIWFGEQYLLVEAIVWISVLNIFIHVMQMGLKQYSRAAGLFVQNRKIDLTSCGLNIVFSIMGVWIWGIEGVLAATFIARSVEFYLRMKAVFEYVVKSGYGAYLWKTARFFLLFLLELGILWLVKGQVQTEAFLLEFLIYGFIAVVMPFALNVLFYHKTEDFKYIVKELEQIGIKRK